MQPNMSRINGVESLPPRSKTAPYEVLAVDPQGARTQCEEICVEETVNIILNDRCITRLVITPEDLAAFVTGYLVCEGVVKSTRDIHTIREEFPDIYVTATGIPPGLSADMEIRSSGSPGVAATGKSPDIPLENNSRISLQTLFSGMNRINQLATTWRRTGGTHCTILLDTEGRVIASSEDMGRHSSVDKAVGTALISGFDLSRCFMVCSGRLPEGMVRKAYYAGICILASNNAPFTSGIDLARRVNMTLVGFARPPRAILYSVPERIVLPQPE
jgi:FdhD protein